MALSKTSPITVPLLISAAYRRFIARHRHLLAAHQPPIRSLDKLVKSVDRSGRPFQPRKPGRISLGMKQLES